MDILELKRIVALEYEPPAPRCEWCEQELPCLGVYGGVPIYAHRDFRECEIEHVANLSRGGAGNGRRAPLRAVAG
jgi:hypothetical protein